MKLVKTVNDEGDIDITLGGKPLDFELSRKLTGTTDEKDVGIFISCGEECFTFGAFQNVIYFPKGLDLRWDSEEIAEEISARIDKVCAWVADCKSTAGSADVVSKTDIGGV